MAKEVKVVIKLKDELTKGLEKIGSKLKKFASGGVRLVGKLTSSFVKLAKVGIAGAVAGFAALIAKSVQTAASYEQLETRLGAVIGSAAEAEKRFKEIKKFAAATPLQLDDLVKADILLKSVGKSGQAALKGVASAAATMGRSVEDIALAVVSLESESLKKLGIQLKTTGDQFEFNFTDKAGNAVVLLAEGVAEARKELTGIFSSKFGAGLVAASETVAGKFSTFKDNVKEAFAVIGDQILPIIERTLDSMTKTIKGLIADGTLEEFGKRIAEAFAFLERIVNTIIENNEKFKQLVIAAGDVIVEKFKAGANAAIDIIKANLAGAIADSFAGALRGLGRLLPESGPGKLDRVLADRRNQALNRKFGLGGSSGGTLDASGLPESATQRFSSILGSDPRLGSAQLSGDRGVTMSPTQGPINVNVMNTDEFPAGGLQ